MRLMNGALALVLLFAGQVAAQQPEPGAWFGISRSSTGRPTNERFEVEARAANAVIRSAPFGRTPTSWETIGLRPDGSIEFPWAANSPLLCVLRRSDPRNYEGTCQGSGQTKRRLTLSRNRPSMGLELPVSRMDFRILVKAGPRTLFCALYHASIEQTGEFWWGRPAVNAIRAAVIADDASDKLQHPLMEFNGAAETKLADVQRVLDVATAYVKERQNCWIQTWVWGVPMSKTCR